MNIADLDKKLDKIDVKLDNFIERIVKVETETAANKGWIKIIVSTMLGAISAGAIFLAKYIASMFN
jgi:hypothetical protein